MATFVGVTPTGTIDGINSHFTLGTVLPTSVEVYKSGLIQTQGIDFVLSTSTGTATLTFLPTAIPQVGEGLATWVWIQ